ncbi:hypothetical protein Bhyg_00521 [Pseudolycoriella hygida]|uniref:Uncharacterized protein n=1 Tax=Pseudolycoriella hygida TaxID=35572 RepID=A0A9Q0N9C9_9DIPT|nr:hypothetical protein Bhyg_00521 [Pseudolycoriella hygida]
MAECTPLGIRIRKNTEDKNSGPRSPKWDSVRKIISVIYLKRRQFFVEQGFSFGRWPQLGKRVPVCITDLWYIFDVFELIVRNDIQHHPCSNKKHSRSKSVCWEFAANDANVECLSNLECIGFFFANIICEIWLPFRWNNAMQLHRLMNDKGWDATNNNHSHCRSG